MSTHVNLLTNTLYGKIECQLGDDLLALLRLSHHGHYLNYVAMAHQDCVLLHLQENISILITNPGFTHPNTLQWRRRS